MRKSIAIDRFATLCMLPLSVLLTSVPFGLAEAPGKGVWPTKEWLTSTPEEQDMDSTALAKLVVYGASHNLDSPIVVRHGRIVTEEHASAMSKA